MLRISSTTTPKTFEEATKKKTKKKKKKNKMGGKKAKGKHRLDKFYYLAKEQGFRARSAFKLVQLNRKYDFLSSAKATLDLCAAPGGWLQVAQKYMPMQSTIVGIDLAAIKPIRGCTTLVEDITTPSCRAAIKRVTPEGMKYDCVLHDGAPMLGATTRRKRIRKRR